MLTISIPFMIAVIIFLFIILFGLTIYLLIQKGKRQKFNIAVDYYTHQYSNDWYAFLIDGHEVSTTMLPITNAHFIAIEKILLNYLKNYHTAKTIVRISNFANEYMTDFYEKQLTSSSFSKKSNSLYRIYDFKISQLLPLCEQMKLAELDEDSRLHLLKIYALLKPDYFLSLILQPNMVLAEVDYRQLFLIANDSTFEQLHAYFEKLNPTAQCAFVEVVAAAQREQYVPYLHMLLQGNSSELRIRSLRAIHYLNYADSLDRYNRFLTSKIWEERMLLARILQMYPTEQGQLMLAKLLEDTHYLVRLEAGQTYIKLKDGQQWLQAFLTTSSDKYALEMAQAALDQRRSKL